MPPSGVDYASEFLNGYAPEYVTISKRFFLGKCITIKERNNVGGGGEKTQG